VKRKTRGNLKSVEKAIRLLDCFGLDTPELSIADLVEKLAMPKVSVYRFLRVLKSTGFIAQDQQNKKYHLGLKIFELGSIVLRQFPLREVAFPLISELSKRSGETVHLGVLDNQQVVSIEGVESDQSLRISLPIGKRVYLHSTGIGKAILAFLPDSEIERIIAQKGLPKFTPNTIVDREQLMKEILLIRSRGYAIDDEENEPEIRCVAAPVFGSNKRVLASISISGPSVRIQRARVPELSSMVIETSRRISKALGYNARYAYSAHPRSKNWSVL
jgi:DNA-binding IclR family transcriptional regulator